MDDAMKLRLELALGNKSDDDVCIVLAGDLRTLLLEFEDAEQEAKDVHEAWTDDDETAAYDAGYAAGFEEGNKVAN